MNTLLVGVAIAALVLVNAHDIASAGQVGSVVKPNIRTPRIIVRPRNVTPPTKRLIKKNTVEEVTNPAATQGGSAAEAASPVQSRTPPRLRKQIRMVAAIPRPRPYTFMDFMRSIEAKNPHGNVNELVFLVMREALQEMNEDKKYFLRKLKDYNTMGEAISDYLSDLAPENNQTETDNAMAGQLLQLIEAESSAARRAESKLRAALTTEQFQTLLDIQPILAGDPLSPEAVGAWEAFVKGANLSEIEVNALVQWVLKESYLEALEDLRTYADKVKYYNNQKKAVREHLNSARAEPCQSRDC